MHSTKFLNTQAHFASKLINDQQSCVNNWICIYLCKGHNSNYKIPEYAWNWSYYLYVYHTHSLFVRSMLIYVTSSTKRIAVKPCKLYNYPVIIRLKRTCAQPDNRVGCGKVSVCVWRQQMIAERAVLHMHTAWNLVRSMLRGQYINTHICSYYI